MSVSHLILLIHCVTRSVRQRGVAVGPEHRQGHRGHHAGTRLCGAVPVAVLCLYPCLCLCLCCACAVPVMCLCCTCACACACARAVCSMWLWLLRLRLLLRLAVAVLCMYMCLYLTVRPATFLACPGTRLGPHAITNTGAAQEPAEHEEKD